MFLFGENNQGSKNLIFTKNFTLKVNYIKKKKLLEELMK